MRIGQTGIQNNNVPAKEHAGIGERVRLGLSSASRSYDLVTPGKVPLKVEWPPRSPLFVSRSTENQYLSSLFRLRCFCFDFQKQRNIFKTRTPTIFKKPWMQRIVLSITTYHLERQSFENYSS